MAKQKFQGKTLYTKTCVDNILRVFDQTDAEDRRDWYCEARKFASSLSDITGIPTIKVCGVIAALSPQTSWDVNKKLAEEFLRTSAAGHTKMFLQKAEDILSSTGNPEDIADILNGNKITSFFLNIYYPDDNRTVTIDRHAQDVALNGNMDPDKRSMTQRQYEFFCNCYRIAAAKRGVPPYLMQSATWVKWRKMKKQINNVTEDGDDKIPF